MKGIEYNDLWTILQNLPRRDTARLPQKYIDFVKSCMIPDAVSSVRTDVSLEEQTLSENTRDLLASLWLTYWADSPQERRRFAETLHENELRYQGKPAAPMTDEEYRELLGCFDYWNEVFGPIPDWVESRYGRLKSDSELYLKDPALLERIRFVAEKAEEASDHAVKLEEYVALPCFGQIVLRFELLRDEVSLEELDAFENMLYDIAGDEFMVDFMGSVYRKAGVDYSRLDERLLELYDLYADEPIPGSVHSAGIARDAARLLDVAGMQPTERVWEIQPEGGKWVLLVMGERSRQRRTVEEPIWLYVGEVSEKQCTGLIKAAFYARRNRVSLGRLLSGGAQ